MALSTIMGNFWEFFIHLGKYWDILGTIGYYYGTHGYFCVVFGIGCEGDGVLMAQVLFLRRSMGKRLKNRTQGLRIGVKRGAHGG